MGSEISLQRWAKVREILSHQGIDEELRDLSSQIVAIAFLACDAGKPVDDETIMKGVHGLLLNISSRLSELADGKTSGDCIPTEYLELQQAA